MNQEIIIKMVQPYLRNLSITYGEFDNIFNMLSLNEQYGVLEVLAQNHIELRPDDDGSDENAITIEPIEMEICKDEEDIETVTFEKDFEILYDDLIFSNKQNNEDIKNHKNLSEAKKDIKQSNEILCILIQQGNEQARQDLCIKNIKLVDKIANRYEKYFGNDLDFDDLEQAGMIGMLIAAEKFNINFGYAFSTYAIWWIRQAILREICDHGFTIRVSVHVMETIYKINIIDRDLSAGGLEYKKRIEKIAEKLDMTEKYVEKYIVIRNNFLNNISLDIPIDEEDTTMIEITPMETEISVEDEVIGHVLRKQIDDVLKTLTIREQKILDLRFGLTDGRARTLEEIGKLYGVTRERIRQIEAKALKKLRHISRSKKLIDFY